MDVSTYCLIIHLNVVTERLMYRCNNNINNKIRREEINIILVGGGV